MAIVKTPWIGQRALISGLATAAAMPLASHALRADSSLTITPQQTLGPFYPNDWTGDIDNDLVLVQGEAAKALGHITHVSGKILDAAGQPVRNAQVEIWQCDANGIYRHPRDTSWFAKRERDPGFQSRGRMTTDAEGNYSFRTIRPVAYPGRTPHIHVKVDAPGKDQLVTQMYVEGDPGNERDGILNSLPERERASVIVRLEEADRLEQGALAGVFNIVMG
ncbi:MAG: protocatechuate 3,4-dioxygenase [Hyphomicrobiaceae bacterium]|nr:protocatechuate 3,4-dioxygenase [Hyphomicrobiaceae bacterium]